MNISFYSARSGLMGQARALDIYSNNVANISTNGYKAHRPSFSDLLYTENRQTEPDWQTGHGSRVAKTDFLYSQSSFQMTESPLDYALPNDGFFAVENSAGQINYTRNGEFAISLLENQWFLTSSNGEFVLDYDGNRITVPFQDPASIDHVSVMEQIGVFSFDNPYGLDASGNNTYSQTARSGEAIASPELDKLSYALERSNVDIATEMVNLIQTQRAYQLNAKVISTSDELIRISNNLR